MAKRKKRATSITKRSPGAAGAATAKPRAATAPVVVDAVSMTQDGKTMYAFVIDSKVLRDICTVSRRSEDKDHGYQRHLKETRLRQVARFIDAGGVIPNNIIIDFFDPAVSYNNGKLTIPTDRIVAWVIDGQHRLFGFSYAKKSYPLLVLAFLQLPIKEQVQLFITINTEQKKLPSSLGLDLLEYTGDPEKDLATRCREIVALLNEEAESPWYQQINMTGEGPGSISLTNFTRKLRPLLDTGGVLKAHPFDFQYGVMLNFWTAVKAVFADQWNAKGSVLTKTLGFGALMNAFTTIFTKTLIVRQGKFTVSEVVEVLKLIKDFKFDAETLGSGSGNRAEMAAGSTLESEFLGAITAAQPEGTATLKLF